MSTVLLERSGNLSCCNDASLTFSIDVTDVVNNSSWSKPSLAATPTVAPRVSDTSVAATETGGASRSAAAATTTATAVPLPEPDHHSNSKTKIIAIAVAVPVVLIILALVVCGCLERRKRKTTRVQAPAMKPPFTQMPPQQGMQGNYMQPRPFPPAYTDGAGYMRNMTPQPSQLPAVPELGGQSSTSAPTQKRGVPVLRTIEECYEGAKERLNCSG